MELQYGIRCFTLHLLLFMGAYLLTNPTQVNGKRNIEEIILKLPKQTSPKKLKIMYSFFTKNDLKLGNTLPLYLGGMHNSNKLPPFLPGEQAQSIPFSSSELSALLNFFGIQPGSPQAEAMKETLELCEVKPMGQEAVKICATSKEAMVEFVSQAFRLNTDESGSTFRALRTTTMASHQSSELVLQNYTIIDEPRPIEGAPRMVGCHMLAYPYAIYYCHFLHGENKMFEVKIRGENGVKVKGMVVCHMDTSHFSPNHIVFDFLGIKYGESDASICHVFPKEDLIWLPPLNHGSMTI